MNKWLNSSDKRGPRHCNHLFGTVLPDNPHHLLRHHLHPNLGSCLAGLLQGKLEQVPEPVEEGRHSFSPHKRFQPGKPGGRENQFLPLGRCSIALSNCSSRPDNSLLPGLHWYPQHRFCPVSSTPVGRRDRPDHSTDRPH